jgi:hypothetical protein
MLKTGLVVSLAGLLTWAWYHTLVLVPASEWLWTCFNSLFGGSDPGLAYDLEFLTVATLALVASWLMAGAAVRWLIAQRH